MFIKAKTFEVTQPVKASKNNGIRYHLKVSQKQSQQLRYVYLYNCQSSRLLENKRDIINARVQFLNNGSHFGQDQKIFWPYILLVACWIFIMIKYGIPIFKTFAQITPDLTKIAIYVGILLLGVSYFYKLLHLMVYWQDGKGIGILWGISIVFKNITEGIVVTVIVSIAWGWSIVHLRHDQTYIITGTVSALINIVGLVLDLLAEEVEEDHHQYDSAMGFMVVFIRLCLYGIFIVGILRSMAQSAGSSRKFAKHWGMWGSVYLLAWPVTVIFSELLLPPYMHHQVITFVQEAIHLLAAVFLCQMMSNKNSSFSKLSMKEDDDPLQRRGKVY